jgi:hypothetical protein
MPGLLTETWKCKQLVSVTERRELSTMKQAYDLHAAHIAILQKKNYQTHSNKIHQLYNIQTQYSSDHTRIQ